MISSSEKPAVFPSDISASWVSASGPNWRRSPADLREHLQSRGLPTGSHYVPLLIQRYEADGIVTATARGRYRINRDHPDLASG